MSVEHHDHKHDHDHDHNHDDHDHDDHKHDHDHKHGHSHSHSHSHHEFDPNDLHESKTKIVVFITAIAMILEVGAGYVTHSMALIAEGWHMTTHVFAIGLTYIAYVAARKYAETEHYSFKKNKLLSLSGYTSAIILLFVAGYILFESIERLFQTGEIRYKEAIIVAVIGLVVNVISAFFLHHDHEHSDTNIRAAYIHVLADGLTSFTAIVALLCAKYFHLSWLDAASGIVGSVVIASWSFSLIKNSGKELIEFNKKVKSE